MIVVILSPVLAFILHLVDQKLRLSKRLVFIIGSFLTIPTCIVWLSGYNFRNENILSSSKMLIIATILWGMFSFIHKRLLLKTVLTVLIMVFLSGFIFLSSMGKSWAGTREVLATAVFENYVALELGPQLYESDHILRVKKTQIKGFIEKVVFETPYKPEPEKLQCKEYFNDDKTQLVYNFCVKTISSR